MTATIISIFTRLPACVVIPLSRWRPSNGDRVMVSLPRMEADDVADWPAVVRSGLVGGEVAVELDDIRGRSFAVGIERVRPGNDQPTGPEAA